MRAKIKLKLNQKAYLRNKRYEIFLDDNFVGFLDYRNIKMDVLTNTGNHKILVKGKDFEKEHHFLLSSTKLVQPIEINENLFWTRENVWLPKTIKTALIIAVLLYAVFITFLLYSKKIEFSYFLILPFLILFFASSSNQKFEINFK